MLIFDMFSSIFAESKNGLWTDRQKDGLKDRQTDLRMDRHIDQQADIASYRYAWTHLKIQGNMQTP